MIEVVPELLGVEQFKLFLLIAQQVAHAPIVEEDAPFVVDDAHSRRTVVQDFAELALLLDDLELVPGQRRDVVDPKHPLAADEADVATAIGDLCIGQQQVEELAALGAPNHFLVQKLPAAVAQRCDDPGTLFEVVPELAGVDAVELVLRVSKQLAQPRVVKQQPAILVHDQQRRRTELQDFAELALVLGGLSIAGRAVAVAHRRSTCCRVKRHKGFSLTFPANANIAAGRVRGPRWGSGDTHRP